MSDCPNPDDCASDGECDGDPNNHDSFVCGISVEHSVPDGHTVCRNCDADCSEWDDDED